MSTETIGEGMTAGEVAVWMSAHPDAERHVITPEQDARMAALRVQMREEHDAHLRQTMGKRWVGLIHRLFNTHAYRQFKALSQ